MAEAYLRAKFQLIGLRPTVWPQCTNVTDRTGQDRHGQRTHSIGRIVLQTVAQKRFALRYRTYVTVLSSCSLLLLSCLSVINVLVHCGQTVGCRWNMA